MKAGSFQSPHRAHTALPSPTLSPQSSRCPQSPCQQTRQRPAAAAMNRAYHAGERCAKLTDRRFRDMWDVCRRLRGSGPREGAHTCAPAVWGCHTIISLEEEMPELTLEDKETLERKKESGNWTGQRIRKSLGPQKHGRYNGSGTGRGRSSRTAYQLRKELYYPLVTFITGE